jgi:hypothetical protein
VKYMNGSMFNASDWVYVADSMGRLGQGHYKKRGTQEVISVADYEQRRSQASQNSFSEKEQNINKINRSDASSEEKETGITAQLTPWDNPVSGEQLVQEERKLKTAQEKIEQAEEKAVQPKQIQSVKKENDNSGEASQMEFGGYTAPAGIESLGPESGMGSSVGNESDNKKVICTELVRQGLMSERDRKACWLYAKRHLSDHFMKGYHFWAVPYVRLMRRYDWAVQMINPFVRSRTAHIRHRLGFTEESNWVGRLICAVHDPMCDFLGRFVSGPDVQCLYENDLKVA